MAPTYAVPGLFVHLVGMHANSINCTVIKLSGRPIAQYPYDSVTRSSPLQIATLLGETVVVGLCGGI